MIVEILQPTSVPYSFQGNVKYPFMRVIKRHFILNDNLHQSIIRDTSGRFLMAAALNDTNQAGKQTARSSSLLLFLYFFQAFYFQRIHLSRLLALHSFSRTEGCVSPQLKPLQRQEPQPHLGASQEGCCPWEHWGQCAAFWPSISFGSLSLILLLKMRKLSVNNVKWLTPIYPEPMRSHHPSLESLPSKLTNNTKLERTIISVT